MLLYGVYGAPGALGVWVHRGLPRATQKAPRDHFGRPQGAPEPSLRNLGPTLAPRGPTWGQLGANLGPFWGQFGVPQAASVVFPPVLLFVARRCALLGSFGLLFCSASLLLHSRAHAKKHRILQWFCRLRLQSHATHTTLKMKRPELRKG